MKTTCPLNLLSPGETSTVTRLAGGDQLIGRLAAMGFSPGAEVTMVRNSQRGPLIVMTRKTRIALGRGEAHFVQVKVTANHTPDAGGSGSETEY